MRVLYSFPHAIGASRICTTAWEQVTGLDAAGASLVVYPSRVAKPLPPSIVVRPTLSVGRMRVPISLLGRLRAFKIHDRLVAGRLAHLAGRVDLVHAWPLGALKTLETASRLGIPTVLERPNAHTRFAYEVVRLECDQLGISLPSNHEHSFNQAILDIEEAEYQAADKLLCPSDFVRRTFLERGFPPEKLVRHQYGFDPSRFYPAQTAPSSTKPLTLLFAGGCAPRKGLHFALAAWLQSPASEDGQFLIAGAFVPGYAERLERLIRHPSVRVLGHRDDLADLMRASDILVLPSLEEGSALVTAEARGCGCVLLVSDAAGALCTHMENALVHRAGDVQTLARQIAALHEDRSLLITLRARSLATTSQITWKAAGSRLFRVYEDVIARRSRQEIVSA
jgi:glycosyltransferase involved in cell wall biosynthesis